MTELDRNFHETWIGLVQPSAGLVVSTPVLIEKQCTVRHGAEVQRRLAALCTQGDIQQIADLDEFLREMLDLPPEAFPHRRTVLRDAVNKTGKTIARATKAKPRRDPTTRTE